MFVLRVHHIRMLKNITADIMKLHGVHGVGNGRIRAGIKLTCTSARNVLGYIRLLKTRKLLEIVVGSLLYN